MPKLDQGNPGLDSSVIGSSVYLDKNGFDIGQPGIDGQNFFLVLTST